MTRIESQYKTFARESIQMQLDEYDICFLALAKVLDWNSIRGNQIYSVPFRNLFPNQSEKRFVSCLMEYGQT